MNQTQQSPRLRVDTHVHVHPCFEEIPFLEAAAANLDISPGSDGRISGLLCLTETAEADWFGETVKRIGETRAAPDQWRFEPTDEPNAILAVDTQGRQIAIVAGRQIVTAEGLEVLALGLAGRFDDGRPTREVLVEASATGAVPVLPWGFGKWTARRGRLVRELIADPPCAFYLGDNGGRLSLMAEPPEFATGREQGMAILPGTDPFPFRWDIGRVGSFGLEFDRSLDARRPFASLRALLDDEDARPRAYGRLERLPGFLRNQFAIQVRKWSRKLRA